MGDIADWVNDQMQDDDLLYTYGGLKKCHYCGEEGLHWDWDDERDGWRLFDADDELHCCLDHEQDDAASAFKGIK